MRIHDACADDYDELQRLAREGHKPSAAIWKSLETAFARARRDAQFADPIPARWLPRHFRDRYGAANLYCVDLAGFHRGFYTIEHRVVYFLDVVDHATYDKWFPNKGK
ncbi:MAG: hypothetical protein AABY18_05545 [Candidatus Thermoplasmatota archaeon]